MPTVLFDITVRPSTVEPVESLRESEKDALFRQQDIATAKPKVAGSTTLREEVVEPVGLSLEDLSQGYTELEARLENVLEKVTKRSEGLDYVFDPMQFDLLSEAISTIFKGTVGKITFAMYRKALELDRDLAILLGESEHGLA